MRRSVLRITTLVISGLLMVSLAGDVLAVEPNDRPVASREQLINLDLKDCPLKQVFEYLFKDNERGYELDPALNEPPYDKVTVSLSLRNVTFIDALRSICKAHGLTYIRNGGPYMIAPKREGTITDQAQADVSTPRNGEQQVVGPNQALKTDKEKLEHAVVRWRAQCSCQSLLLQPVYLA